MSISPHAPAATPVSFTVLVTVAPTGRHGDGNPTPPRAYAVGSAVSAVIMDAETLWACNAHGCDHVSCGDGHQYKITSVVVDHTRTAEAAE